MGSREVLVYFTEKVGVMHAYLRILYTLGIDVQKLNANHAWRLANKFEDGVEKV